jgi:hypothetical protein
MMESMEWEPLASRRKQSRLCTMYKITNDLISINKSKYLKLATETRTRGTHTFKYYVEHATKDVFKYSYFPRTVREWNGLPSDIVTAKSIHSFKIKLNDHLRAV